MNVIPWIGSEPAQIRIVASLIAYLTAGAMSADEIHMIAERQDLVADGIEYLLAIATSKIGATDGTMEQHVADMDNTLRSVEKGNMAGRMAGTMQYFKNMVAEGNGIALIEPSVGKDILNLHGQTIAFGLAFEPFEQPQVVLVRSNNFETKRVL